MDEFAEKLNELLVGTYRCIGQIEENMVKAYSNVKLSISELHLIEAIGRNESGKSIGQIAGSLEITAPSVTVAINKLIKKGHVKKIKSEHDARVTKVILTEMGIRVDRIHQYFHRKMVGKLTRGLSREDKQLLISAISKLNSFFKRELLTSEEA